MCTVKRHKTSFNIWRSTLILCAVFHVVQSNPGNLQLENHKTVSREWNSPDSEQIKNGLHKRGFVSDPIRNGGKQLSTFVSLINSAILGEAIVQNLTTFGEIGVNLMLMENMPAGEDWISSVDPNDIDMEKIGDLQKILENGLDKKVSIDVLEKITTAGEISSLDTLSSAHNTIQSITDTYTGITGFSFDQAISTVNTFVSVSKSLHVLPRLANNSELLETFRTGIEIMKNISNINVPDMRTSSTSCKTSINSAECTSGFAVLREISSSSYQIENIEAVAIVLGLIQHRDEIFDIIQLRGQKNIMILLYKKLSEVQNLIKTGVQHASLQENISKLLSSLDKLKVEESEVEKLDEVLEVFRPLSEAISRMQTTYRSNSHKKVEKDNKQKIVFDSFKGLPDGIVTLSGLSETVRNSKPPPDEYRNSKIAERIKLMEDFTEQRMAFLKFSKGVKSIQHFSSIVKRFKSFLTDFKTFEDGLKSVPNKYEKLISIENIDDGINVLKELEAGIKNFDGNKVLTESLSVSASINTKSYYELFPPLARVLKAAKGVDEHMKANGTADETIFSEAIAATEQLSKAFQAKKKSLAVPSIEDFEGMKNMISNLSLILNDSNSKTLTTGTFVNRLKTVEDAHEKIISVVSQRSEHSQFATSLTELKKLKVEMATRPNQTEIDDFKSMMTELNSLKPLEIPPELKTGQKSPHFTLLMRGTPFGAEYLGSLSKELNDYLDLIEGIPSIQEFEKGTVDTAIKNLLVGVDAIQFLDAKDRLGAYDVFIDPKTLESRMRNFDDWIDIVKAKIRETGLNATIEKKADSSVDYRFLNRLQKLEYGSMPSFRRDIYVILISLKHGINCQEDRLNKLCDEKQKRNKNVVYPVLNAGKQLSTFVSLINSAILGEAIVQNSTTFGEISVNLMLMQNMPLGGDWISSVNPDDTFIGNIDELQRIMEYGFNGNTSVDVIEKVIAFAQEISSCHSFDLILKVSDTVQRIIAIQSNSPWLKSYETIQGVKLLGFLSVNLPTLTNLTKNVDPLSALTIGGEIITNLSQINVDKMKEGYESCKTSIASDKCVSGFDVFRNISFDKVSIENIEIVDVLLDYYVHSYDGFRGLQIVLESRDKLITLCEKLLELQSLVREFVDYNSIRKKFSTVLSLLDKLNLEKLELESLAETLGIFLPVSQSVAKMHNTYRNKSEKMMKNGDQRRTNNFDFFRGLSQGIVTLRELSEVIERSADIPHMYRNSQIVERVRLMKEFSDQRGSFLKFSEGVKSIQHILSVIESVQTILSPNSKPFSFVKTMEDMLTNLNLKILENIPDGINALKDIENRIAFLNYSQVSSLPVFWDTSSHTKALRQLFSPLARVIRSAKQIDQVLTKQRHADEKIYLEAFSSAELLSRAIHNNINNFRAPDAHDVRVISDQIKKIDLKSFKTNKVKLPVNAVINALESIEYSRELMEHISSKKTEYFQLITSLKDLKNKITNMPSRKEFDDLKSFLDELNDLNPLMISPMLKNAKPSSYIMTMGATDGIIILSRLSNELGEYKWLTEGILSIQDFEDETVEESVRDLLVGVDSIQVVVANNNFSAYDIFNDSKMIDDRFRKLVKYLDITEEAILRSGARPGIEEKVDLSLAYDFLSKFQKSVSRSMNSFRHDIWWICMALEHGIDCDKRIHPLCLNDKKEAPNPKDDTKKIFLITMAVFVLSCVIFIVAVSLNNILMAEDSAKSENPEPETIATSTSDRNVQDPGNDENIQMAGEDVLADGGTEYSTDYSIFSEV